MRVPEQIVTIPLDDGVHLAATLYLPDGDGPHATLIEALPYRMNDITASYADSYARFADEGEFAVLRIDLRGTGSSGGIATDEYPDVERRDLRAAIEWVAAQPWSTGRVGMFGTSYSGFNSLHMAAEGIPELGAVVAMYATDDRYTDDVHYIGGVLRSIDLIDYPLYMVAMNGLPPVPAVWGEGWVDEWQRRIDQGEPWMLEWLRHPLNGAMWRRGSIRLGPEGAGYERLTCPVMLIAGWADGYRNNTFRAVEHLPEWRLLAGPWSHKDPSTARPGPNIDSDREIMAFFHEHLRSGPPAAGARGRVFVRRPTAPQPDLALHDGRWVELDTWPDPGLQHTTRRPDPTGDDTIDELVAQGDVGVTAWNSCAGGLPWGQPIDQRVDNARSISYDWTNTDELMLVGNAEVAMQLRSSATVGHVSVKLCDVAPDGTSTLITRGMLDLTQRGVWPSDPWGEPGAAPRPMTPNEWVEVRVQLEATTWTLVPGHRIRLAIAGTDWPNCWPPPQPFVLGVRRATVRLTLPTVPDLPAPSDQLAPGQGPGDGDADGVQWRHEHDVLARESRVVTRYGGTYAGTHGTTVTDSYEGALGVSTVDLSRAWARGRSSFTLAFAEATCSTEAALEMHSDSEWFYVDLALTATCDGEPFAERRWTERFAR